MRPRRKWTWQKLSCLLVIFGIGLTYMYLIARVPNSPSAETTDDVTQDYAPLYSDDIINPHPYHFTITNHDQCQNESWTDEEPFLLILVKVAPTDFYDRQQIRQTWGGTRRTVNGKLTTTLFLIGLNENTEVNQQIQEESMLYRDIVQENFLDAYQNLTIKNIMGMKWVATFCPNATYVASADADVMLNTYNLVDRLLGKPRKSYAEGSLRVNAKPVRKPTKHDIKWFTPKKLYPEATYPPFFPGSCYVMSGDVASDIYYESQHVRFLPWDDVFIGLVMKRIGIRPTPARGYEQYVRLNMSKSVSRALMRGIAVLIRHQVDSVDEKLVELWKSVTLKSEKKHHTHSFPFLQFFLLVTIIGVFFLVSFIAGVALMTL